MKEKKTDLVKKELVKLNEKFHKKLLMDEAFYKQLIQGGFVYHQCLLVSIFPDSCNTYSGKIIRQDGNVFEFDIDLNSAEYTSFKDVTDIFQELYKKTN